jgi:hypothetical protein
LVFTDRRSQIFRYERRVTFKLLVHSPGKVEAIRDGIPKKKPNETNIDDVIGFRRVLEAIVSSKQLLVGHNMIFDLMHLYKFFYPLPEAIETFQRKIHEFFPKYCILILKSNRKLSN